MKAPSQSTQSMIRFGIFITILAGCAFLGKILNIDIERYRVLLMGYPLYISAVLFIVLYVALTLLIWFGPKDLFRVAGAVLFGPYLSTLFVWIAEMINCLILFNLSRAFGRDFVFNRFGITTDEVDNVKKETDFFGVFALRINPLVPYRFLDLTYGLTKVPFKKYFAIAVVSSPPRLFWLQFILAGVGVSIFKNVDALVVYLVDHINVLMWSFFYLLAVFIISMVAVIRKIVMRKRRKKAEVISEQSQ